jgi:hypothetical protein
MCIRIYAYIYNMEFIQIVGNYVYAYMYLNMYVYTYIQIFVNMYIYLYIYLYINLNVYINTIFTYFYSSFIGTVTPNAEGTILVDTYLCIYNTYTVYLIYILCFYIHSFLTFTHIFIIHFTSYYSYRYCHT